MSDDLVLDETYCNKDSCVEAKVMREALLKSVTIKNDPRDDQIAGLQAKLDRAVELLKTVASEDMDIWYPRRNAFLAELEKDNGKRV